MSDDGVNKKGKWGVVKTEPVADGELDCIKSQESSLGVHKTWLFQSSREEKNALKK